MSSVFCSYLSAKGGSVKQLLEFEQGIMYALSLFLCAFIVSIVYYGVRTHYSPHNSELRSLMLAKHKKSFRWGARTVGLIILVVECAIVPSLGRHFSELLKIHLSLDGVFVLAGISAYIFNGNRWPAGHWILGYLAAFFGILVGVTGFMVTYRL